MFSEGFKSVGGESFEPLYEGIKHLGVLVSGDNLPRLLGHGEVGLIE